MDQQPVQLVASRPEEWADRFALVAGQIARLIVHARVAHIGSTAVPALPAKDVVDLMVGVEADALAGAAQLLTAAAYDLEGATPHHYWFSWPSRDDRQAVLHLLEYGERSWNRRLASRDLLRHDPDARQVYLEAKHAAALATDGWADYTQAKASTVADLLDAD